MGVLQEQCRFAVHDQGPPFVRRDGRKIKGPKELRELGFHSMTLHESRFANNIIQLETKLQTLLWNESKVIDDFDGHFFISKRGYLACRSESREWKRSFDHVSSTVHSCAFVSIMTF